MFVDLGEGRKYLIVENFSSDIKYRGFELAICSIVKQIESQMAIKSDVHQYRLCITCITIVTPWLGKWEPSGKQAVLK